LHKVVNKIISFAKEGEKLKNLSGKIKTLLKFLCYKIKKQHGK
jgi:hypothetical protein